MEEAFKAYKFDTDEEWLKVWRSTFVLTWYSWVLWSPWTIVVFIIECFLLRSLFLLVDVEIPPNRNSDEVMLKKKRAYYKVRHSSLFCFRNSVFFPQFLPHFDWIYWISHRQTLIHRTMLLPQRLRKLLLQPLSHLLPLDPNHSPPAHLLLPRQQLKVDLFVLTPMVPTQE